MDPDKIKAIIERKPPRNVKEDQEWLGICNYYRYFIKDFAAITKPLTNLLNKDKKFIWTQDCDDSFNLIKKFLTSYPILRAPDFTRTFILVKKMIITTNMLSHMIQDN
jgi:hypothetical protein